MLDNSLPASGEIAHQALESNSPFPELQFDGFGARSDDASIEKTRGSATRVVEISGARYKSMSPAKLPISRSLHLTIPSGFSPSVLLESPVLLTNIKVRGRLLFLGFRFIS